MRTIKVTPDFYDNTREQYDAKLAARTINEKALYFVLEPNGHRTLYKGTQIVGAKLDELNETIDKLNAILQDAPEEFDTLVELATVLTQLKADIEAAEQQIADLQANKLNKIWSDITEQTTTNLTDILVFNRGSNVYKTTIANLLDHVAVVELFTVVAELPEAALPNKIYLVPSSEPETQNALDEYIWVGGAWEKIGAVSVDLSNYYNKTDVDSMLDVKVDKVSGKGLSTNDYTNTDKQSVEKIPTIEQDILDLESNKVDKVSGKGLSTNDFTNNDKNKLDGIEAGAEVNPYSKTQLDNMLESKVDKNADITPNTFPKITYDEKGLVIGGEALAASDIPSLAASKISAGTFDEARIPSLSPTKITQNASNRFVTDTEKSTWNSKVDKAQLDLKADITYVDDMLGDIENALDAILGV